MAKERVDKLLVQQGLVNSREQAKRLVMAGQVYDSKEQRYDKPGMSVPVETEFKIKGSVLPYVSRGGLKLEKALKEFELDITDQILLDIGASTGGFTDCALQNGAAMSYALDVGYNQLDYKLRQDPRVEVMERVNFRYAEPKDFTKGQPTVASIDVSFISLDLIIPPLVPILALDGLVIALIKPQFEAGRERVGKRGLVKDPLVHISVIEEVFSMMSENGIEIKGLTYSPITGGTTGNIEFLCYGINSHLPNNTSWKEIDIEAVVEQAHKQFS